MACESFGYTPHSGTVTESARKNLTNQNLFIVEIKIFVKNEHFR